MSINKTNRNEIALLLLSTLYSADQKFNPNMCASDNIYNASIYDIKVLAAGGLEFILEMDISGGERRRATMSNAKGYSEWLLPILNYIRQRKLKAALLL